MPASLKVVLVVNVLTAAAILLAAAVIGGGFTSGSFPPDEGHEIKLIPIGPDDPAYPRRASAQMVTREVRRPEIPPEYRASDPTPAPWVVMADGSVRFVRND